MGELIMAKNKSTSNALLYTVVAVFVAITIAIFLKNRNLASINLENVTEMNKISIAYEKLNEEYKTLQSNHKSHQESSTNEHNQLKKDNSDLKKELEDWKKKLKMHKLKIKIIK